MYEINDIVRFRQWRDKPWEEGTWIIIHVGLVRFYDDEFYLYDIQNQETGGVQSEVNWQQIEVI